MHSITHHAQIDQHPLASGVSVAAATPQHSAQQHATNAQDFAWEFGWSFDGGGWLLRCEPEPMQFSSLDKALALAG